MAPKNILVVDDEEMIAKLVQALLERDGHKVITANSGKAALELLGDRPFDLILTDIKMPEITGDALYSEIRARDEQMASRIVFMTGDTVNKDTWEFIKRTGSHYVPKPFSGDELIMSVNSAIASCTATC